MSKVPRIFCPEMPEEGASLRLDDRAAKHLVRVLRLGAGAEIRLFDGKGREHRAVLSSISSREVVAQLLDRLGESSESPLEIKLVQGVSRGDRMNFVVQKATELGVSYIQPVITTRSVVRLDGARAEKKRSHWQSVAASACEQCGRNVVPDVATPQLLGDAVHECNPDALRLLMDTSGGKSLNEMTPAGRPIILLIGPEGGFDAAERENAIDSGFEPVCLGPRVLRTETAAITALAIMQSLWGDLSQ
jgi:16S rRNA (uracil1498-N3)-methyltransferase